jgi:hypothetical protein
MKSEEFQLVQDRFIAEMRGVTARKNPDYSVNDDVLSNFKEIAKWLNLPLRQVWATLFFKHVTAIARHCRDGHTTDEPIRARLIDAANYCVLMTGILEDEEKVAEKMNGAAKRGFIEVTGSCEVLPEGEPYMSVPDVVMALEGPVAAYVSSMVKGKKRPVSVKELAVMLETVNDQIVGADCSDAALAAELLRLCNVLEVETSVKWCSLATLLRQHPAWKAYSNEG